VFGLYESAFGALSWGNIIMLVIGGLLIYLGIARKMEPLLLVPIGFGVMLVNLPLGGLMETIVQGQVTESYQIGGEPAGVIARVFHMGLVWEIIPAFIFLGLGAMTDFGPVIANPKTLILGAGAQFGVFFALIVALLLGFSLNEAASIGIIGGADGPTTIFLTNKLAPNFIGTTAVAVYLHGTCSHYPAANYQVVYYQKRTSHLYETPDKESIEKGKNILPDFSLDRNYFAGTEIRTTYRNVHVR